MAKLSKEELLSKITEKILDEDLSIELIVYCHYRCLHL